MKVDILIVDRSHQVVQRLEEMLNDSDFIRYIYTTTGYKKAKQLFLKGKPGVVLLGISIPEKDSLQLLTEINSCIYKSSIIVLFMDMNDYLRSQFSLRGAAWFVDKYKDFENIPAIIQTIAGGNAAGQQKCV